MKLPRALFFLFLTLPVFGAIAGPLTTASGLVSGTAGVMPEVRIFKGIPFAAPPVGDLRWRAPQPAAKWDGVRAADKFSANCVQRQAGGGAFPPNGGDRSATEMSEDCLYLNVYTAAKSAGEKRPVMVWIHGGAWVSGAGAIYEGEELARKGVVMVTVNYRMGPFGFLAHPELSKESGHGSGNYAILDQIAGLQWVQKNIAAFGGDPKRVTIFGESAGSWSVNFLIASPLGKGLFQRGIGESGGEFAPTRGLFEPAVALPEAEQAGIQFGEAAHAPSLAALRAKSADDLMKVPAFRSAATVDGFVLPEDVQTIFAKGKQNDVPVIIGSNEDEGTLFTPPQVKAETLREQTAKRFGPNADAYLKAYPFSTDTEARAAQANSMRDEVFGWEMRNWARMQSKTGKQKVYLYFFSRVPPGPNAARMGSQHGAEIAYALNWVNGTNPAQTAWEDVDKKLADQVSSFWVNFAATGNPNSKGQPHWPAFNAKDEQLLSIGDKIGIGPVPHKAGLDFYEGFFSRVRGERSAK